MRNASSRPGTYRRPGANRLGNTTCSPTATTAATIGQRGSPQLDRRHAAPPPPLGAPRRVRGPQIQDRPDSKRA